MTKKVKKHTKQLFYSLVYLLIWLHITLFSLFAGKLKSYLSESGFMLSTGLKCSETGVSLLNDSLDVCLSMTEVKCFVSCS